MELVFYPGAAGGFLSLVPLLRSLDGPVTVVASWPVMSLVPSVFSVGALGGEVAGVAAMDSELFEFQRMHAEGGPSRVSPAIADLFASAQRVLSYHGKAATAWHANASRLMPDAELVVLEPQPKRAADEHITDAHRRQLVEAGCAVNAIEPEPIDRPQGVVVVCPGDRPAKYCWPLDRYEALIDRFVAMGQRVRPVVTEINRKRWSGDRVERWMQTFSAVAVRSIDQVPTLLSDAKRLIGDDSETLRIAGVLGLPALAVLSEPDGGEGVWSLPRGRHVRWVGPGTAAGAEGIASIQVADVLDAAGLK